MERRFKSFRRSFSVFLTRGKIFYDLGSKDWQSLVEARLLCDFDECIGIEILSSLHEKV